MTRRLVLEITSGLLLFIIARSSGTLFTHTSIRSVLSSSPLIGDKSAVVVLALLITGGLVVAVGLFPGTRIWGIYGTSILITVAAIRLALRIDPTLYLPFCDGVLRRNNNLLNIEYIRI